MRLRVYGLQEGLLVGDPDDAGPLGERGERTVEKTATVAEPITVRVPSEHRQEHVIRADLGRTDGVRDR